MAWSEAVRPCALAALVASILMSLGLHPFVAMPSAGFLAVVFYRQRKMGLPISLLAGIRLGALSGLLFFALSAIIGAAVVLFGHKGDEIRKAVTEAIAQGASRTSDPQLLAMFDKFKTPEGMEFLMVFLIVFSLVASIVLGALGGALGGTILGRRNKG